MRLIGMQHHSGLRPALPFGKEDQALFFSFCPGRTKFCLKLSLGDVEKKRKGAGRFF